MLASAIHASMRAAPAMAPLPWSPTSRSVAMASTNAFHDISHSSDDGAAVEAVSEAASAAADDDELASSKGVLRRRLNCWAADTRRPTP